MMKMLKAMSKSKKGQGMVEYGLIIGLIAVVVITLLATMGTKIQGFFQTIVTAMGG